MIEFLSMNLDGIIETAIREDIGDGDHTSLAIFSPDIKGKARLLIKERGILAGIPVALKVFEKLDPSLMIELYKKDGDEIFSGDIAFEVKGSILSILAAERLVLNFLQRLSGIATLTHEIVSQIAGWKTKILDTRKTTPTLRELEKYAVRVGGGFNHRMGLYDMIMIKDNHVDFARGVVNAIESVHKYLQASDKELKIEIEVRNFEELLAVIAHGKVDRIMLDNFSVEDVSSAVKLVRGRFETEASGGIRINNVREYAETGIDYISIGAFTHNFRSLDMSLKAIRKPLWDDDD
ncbi:MAG: carboxylating nicotinate-nucleotide diphosphorylase [Bacteroidetes bacterium]|nr:carboxylating nicotinate-nucleotide diphosphorylase [Bacteroidota bacterium]